MDITKLLNPKDELSYVTLIVFLFTAITILFLWSAPLISLICVYLPFCSTIKIYIPSEFVIPLSIPILIWFLILAVRVLEAIKAWLKRGSEYTFKAESWPEGWIFNGRPKIIDGNLHIRSTRAGLLLEKYLWRNFRMSFYMRFDEEYSKYVGIIFRARDLDNYFMLEIREKCIAPHIRFKSGWEGCIEEEAAFDFKDFRKVAIEVKEDVVTFFYEDKGAFSWVLPTHADVSHFEAGVTGEPKGHEPATLSKTLSGGHVQKIPFRLDYGMVGFRAHYVGQGAVIRNIEIKSSP